MKFLLEQAGGKYFMWAANDDLWDKDFAKTLVAALDSNPHCVASFCTYAFINEASDLLPIPFKSIDYSGTTAYQRIKKLLKFYDDGFGYGIFKKADILNVKFPVWVWPNNKCAYNNIYPSLFFYLTRGDFSLYTSKPLWFNRLKTKTNHSIPFHNHLLLGYWAFVIRKINLAFCCWTSVVGAGGSISLAIHIIPLLIYRFLMDSLQEWKASIQKYKKKEIERLI
jgi:hypothetical protein